MSELTNNVPATGAKYDETQIQVLEGLEAVRKRPGMYIGSTSVQGLHHLVYEIVDNAIDEALAGYCKNIYVTIRPGNIITVKDDGRGVPTGIHPKMGISTVEVVYTILHAGGKFGGEGYKVSGGLHGVGASVVNALSEWMEVRVCDGKHLHYQRYNRGKPEAPVAVIGDTDVTGTEVTFYADGEIFETLQYEYDVLLKRLREQAFLNAGIHIIFTDERGEEPVVSDLQFEGGVKSFVEFLNDQRKTEGLHPVIHITAVNENNAAEVGLQYTDSYNTLMLSFANNIHTTEGGMHEVGFKTALTKVLNNYAFAHKILKENDPPLEGEDFREGLTAIISVKLTEAQFEGQTKTKLGNSEMRQVVSQMVSTKFAEYLEENPSVARVILDKAITAKTAREAARKAKENIRRKTGLESGQMPDKLQDCNEKDPSLCEIYIVECDSAAGSAIQGRDSRFQAILAMWGKMRNVEKVRADKIYGNDKLYPLIVALGAGIGEKFDIEKLRYHKVIIMADADVDGSHIRTLLLTFFFRYMRPLIERGYVYSAVPPLYKLTRGKTVRVAYSDEERDAVSAELRADNPNAKVEISRFKGLGEMDAHELWDTTMDPEKRSLRRITLDDAVRADEVFSILMGEQVEPRKEWIEKNAQYAVNIDI
ncbi:MAG: DNA topoisomerase (ATP-hydrolyzing) subunit B [Clostridia bacterium]|nr:DNA topoisomerase (ATP-hydrolyzing) subunit B [Clostridia bacterium]